MEEMKFKKLVRMTATVSLLMLFSCSAAFAHRPHDNITDVGVSPEFSSDGTAFVIVMNKTLRITRDKGYTWKTLNNGLDNVYPFTAISVSPLFGRDGYVLVSSQGDGIYRSRDGGLSWDKVNRGLRNTDIRLVLISSDKDGIQTSNAADSDGNLYRLKEEGREWELLFTGDQRISAVGFLSGTESEQMVAGDTYGRLYMYNGTQWEETAGSSQWGAVNAIAVSPEYASDKTFWIGTDQGIYNTTDSGKTFVQSDAGIPEKKITSLVASPNPSTGESTVLYAASWNKALFHSQDGGRSWRKFAKGLSTDIQADMPDYLLPHFKGLAANHSNILLGGFDGLFMSDDGGKSWIQVETWPIGNISSIALSPMIREGRQTAILAYGGGAYRIPDVKQADWTEAADSLTLAGVPGVRTDSGISDIAFSPAFETDQTIFAATEHELLKSIDGGETWTRVTIEKPFFFRVRRKLNHYMRKIGISSSIRLKIAGFFPLIPGWSTYIAISPDFADDGTIFFSTQGLGQCMSTDGGQSCSVVLDTALKLTTSMAISPKFSDDGTLFIGVQGVGVFKTGDGGNSFQKLKSDLPVDGQLKLALSPEYVQDHTVLAGTGKGLYLSEDKGLRWNPVGKEALPENGTILSVAFSPGYKKDRTILVAVKGYGIYRSIDRARTFTGFGKDLIAANEQIKQLVFSASFENDRTVYGVSSDNVFQSRDGGETWKIVDRPVRYEDIRDVITYTGEWETLKGADYSDSTQVRSKGKGHRASLRFKGTGIRLIGERSPEGGSARIYIDGDPIDAVSFRSNTRRPKELIFETRQLGPGGHEITVEVSGSENHAGWIAIDAFEVLP
jgi:photosystem II stability/assembly factor-like uncharacterized protein